MRAIAVLKLIVLTILIAGVALAGGKKFGKELTLKEKTKVSDILAEPEKFDKKRVLVEGTVTDVCAMMGCWMKIDAGKDLEPITIKVEDGVIVFPQEAKGKKALAEGIVSVKTMTKEQLIAQAKHEAEEQGKEFDSSKITGPKTTVRIMGEGAVIEGLE